VRLVICGTRRHLKPREREAVIASIRMMLNESPGAEICVGDCPTGVDAVVRQAYPHARVFTADWDTHGKTAGPLRNRAMCTYAAEDQERYAIPFPDRNEHRGTLSCIDELIRAGVPHTVYPL
jgi:hypothetical protein